MPTPTPAHGGPAAASSVTVTLEPFGPARAWLGPAPRTVALEATEATASGLLAALAALEPAFAPRASRCALARGDALLPRHTPLADGDVLALIPPVSGG